MTSLKSIATAATVLGVAVVGSAEAMPTAKLTTVATPAKPRTKLFRDDHWVCSLYQCWWRPNRSYNGRGQEWPEHYYGRHR